MIVIPDHSHLLFEIALCLCIAVKSISVCYSVLLTNTIMIIYVSKIQPIRLKQYALVAVSVSTIM